MDELTKGELWARIFEADATSNSLRAAMSRMDGREDLAESYEALVREATTRAFEMRGWDQKMIEQHGPKYWEKSQEILQQRLEKDVPV